MMPLKNKTTIVFAPHPDDEVLGCGGTILKKTEQGEDVIVCIATKGDDFEARKAESVASSRYMGVHDTVFLEFPDLNLDKVPRDLLTGRIRNVIEKYNPEEVFIPHSGDLHIDHKILSDAVLVATRPKYKITPKFVLSYETLSETGLNYQDVQNCFIPNVFVDIEDTIDGKIQALMHHETQVEVFPLGRSSKAVKALSVYRGTQCGMKNAEAFVLLRGFIK